MSSQYSIIDTWAILLWKTIVLLCKISAAKGSGIALPQKPGHKGLDQLVDGPKKNKVYC